MVRDKTAAPRSGHLSKKLPKIALLGSGAIFLGWVVLQSSTVGALARRSPTVAERIAPNDPRVELAVAQLQFRQASAKNVTITPEILRRANAALRRAPLADEPFMFAGLSALGQDKGATAERLFTEARRRNPRSRPTRLFLLDRYLRTGRMKEAVGEISILTRLIPETSALLVPELARLALDKKTAMPLVQVLRTDPVLQLAVLNHLAANGAEPRLIMQLAGPNVPVASNEKPPAWQANLLDTLIKRGDIHRAYALWARFAGLKPSKIPHIYDPHFEGRPGPPPFNWTLNSGSAGIAEPTPAKALEVEFYGRQNASLARQLLVLSPGQYNLSMHASGDTTEGGSGLAWTLTCSTGGPPITTIEISSVTYAGKALAKTFNVPDADCPGQWLTLIGTSKEFPNAQHLTLSNLRLTKAGNP